MTELLSADELKRARAEIAKDLGVDLMWGSDASLELQKLPLGIASFDNVLGGGLAFDRITLLIGEYSSGKTLLAMLAIKAAQERGLSVGFVDVEKTWVPEWATTLGIDPAAVVVARPRTSEEAFKAALGMIRRRFGVVVLDSLAAMRAAADMDKPDDEMFDKLGMGTAKLINAGLATISAENKGTLVIVINQLRETIGVTYGNPEVLPGGKGQGFYAWQKIRVRRGAWLEEGTGDAKKRIGYVLRITPEKNKQGAPFRSAEVPFYFTGELDEVAGLIEVAIELGIISGKPPHYEFDNVDCEREKVYGRGRLLKRVREDERLQTAIQERIRALPEVDF